MKGIILGITGQDGSYLAELLLEKGYEVHGVIRRSSSFNTGRIDHIFHQLHLHYGDVTDPLFISSIIHKLQPDEIYNLAAQSHVRVSFDNPHYTSSVDALGTLNVLEAVKNYSPHSKVYQASTSELYGNADVTPQNESTPFKPVSPYGIAKLFSYWMCVNYRESYNLFISNGILFNHGSPRRGETFVEQKIVKSLLDIKNGKESVSFGNLQSRRDIGFAKEYVEGMWLMLQHDRPDDFVLATGESYSIKEMIEHVSNLLEINLIWEIQDGREVGISNSRIIITTDERLLRPVDINHLKGDFSKAKNILGWEPKTRTPELLEIMIKGYSN